MSNTVFVLGAGASKAAGAPLMNNFLDVAHDLWKKGQVKELESNFSDVFGAIAALQAVHSKAQLDINNVESVFAILEMAAILKKFPTFSVEQIQKTIDSLKLLIGVTIEKTLQLPVEREYPRSPVPYGEFAKLIKYLRNDAFPKQSISIITFNYDLACDYAMYQHGIPINYALGENLDQLSTPLLKLHGSLNWVYCPELGKVVPWTMDEHFRKYHWLGLDDSVPFVKLQMMPHLKDFKYQDHEVVPEPVLVPPTWNKAEYHRNLTDVWSRAAQELTDAENIFIIGYSLPKTDAFFRDLFALGAVGDVPLKRLWVFNPDKKVESRFNKMLGPAAASRFQPFFETFANSLEIIKKEFPGRE